MHLLTYSLTPWRRVLLEKLTGSAASQEIPRILSNLHVPNVMKIWEPKPPGTLWTTLSLLQDSPTFTFEIFHLYSTLFL